MGTWSDTAISLDRCNLHKIYVIQSIHRLDIMCLKESQSSLKTSPYFSRVMAKVIVVHVCFLNRLQLDWYGNLDFSWGHGDKKDQYIC